MGTIYSRRSSQTEDCQLKSLRYGLAALLCVLAALLSVVVAWGQNPRSVITTHPRLWLNNTIADTWDPTHFSGGGTKGRLAAIVSRICGNSSCSVAGTSAAAYADFKTVLNLTRGSGGSSSPNFGAYGDEGSLVWMQSYAFAYLVYHTLGNDEQANPYAAAIWAGLTAGPTIGPVGYVTSITTSSSGVATIVFGADPGSTFSVGATFQIRGTSSDAFNGRNHTVLTHTGATLTASGFPASASASNSGILALALPASPGEMDQNETGAFILAGLAYYYDWCYPWLAANGHDQEIRDNLKVGYWTTTLTLGSSGFGDTIRESDFHNYTSWVESPILEVGLALFNDDPLGATILNEGAGYLMEGVSGIVPNGNNPTERFTYNVKVSDDVLTGGSMDWEGSQYHNTGPVRFTRMIEDYDSATGRANSTWTTSFSTAGNAAWYSVYNYNPSPNGSIALFGDAGTFGIRHLTGRDNMLMAIINDRFPDPHFVWMMNNDTSDNWGCGLGGGLDPLGVLYKLVFYPYVNGPGSHDLTDLPLARQFGADVVFHSGWTSGDSLWWFTGSLPGVYHRPPNAGNFGLFRGKHLISQAWYTTTLGSYGWQHTTISSNTVQVFNPSNCWTERGTCGQDYYGNPALVDGGQKPSTREFDPPFGPSWNQGKIWSGTLLNGSGVAPYPEAFHVPPVSFKLWTGVEYAKVDMSKSYTNNYGSQTNSTAYPTASLTANSTGAVTRDFVHFEQTSGDTYPDKVVMFDRVTAANPSFQKSNVIHTVGPIQAHASGSWSIVPAGINTVSATDALRSDNGTARVYIQPLLPATTNTRVVGGHTWSSVGIANATISTNAVFTTNAPHNLTVGENLLISLGAGKWNPQPGNWYTLELAGLGDTTPLYTVASTPTSTTFTLSPAFDSSGNSAYPWATVFGNSGTTNPTGACTAPAMYYNTSTNKPFACYGGHWAAGNPSELYPGPTIVYHPVGGYEGWIDQYGAAGAGGANLWSVSDVVYDTLPTPTLQPQWMAQLRPSTSNLTDYFLTVMTPTTTNLSSGPTSVLIAATEWYGAQVTDTGATYVAMFPTNGATPQTSASYTLTASGTVKHLVTGLAAGTYAVTQGGIGIGLVAAAADGSISFNSTGGGAFQINAAR